MRCNSQRLRTQVFRVFLVVHLVLYYPVHFAVMRHSLGKLFGQDVLQMPLKLYIPLTVRSRVLSACIVLCLVRGRLVLLLLLCLLFLLLLLSLLLLWLWLWWLLLSLWWSLLLSSPSSSLSLSFLLLLPPLLLCCRDSSR
jgi:hypothetical protein